MSGLVLFSLVVMTLLLACAPSKDNMFIIGQTLLNGTWRGVLVATGVCLGIGIYASIAGVFIGLALFYEPDWLVWLKVMGIGFLTYLAFGLMNSMGERLEYGEPIKGDREGMAGGMAIILSRPSFIVFFVAFFSQFLQANEGAWPMSAQLSVILLVFVGLFIGVYILLVAIAHQFGAGPFTRSWVHRVQNELAKTKPFALLLLGVIFWITQLGE